MTNEEIAQSYKQILAGHEVLKHSDDEWSVGQVRVVRDDGVWYVGYDSTEYDSDTGWSMDFVELGKSPKFEDALSVAVRCMFDEMMSIGRGRG